MSNVPWECLFLVLFVHHSRSRLVERNAAAGQAVALLPANRKDQAAQHGKLSFNKYPFGEQWIIRRLHRTLKKTSLFLQKRYPPRILRMINCRVDSAASRS